MSPVEPCGAAIDFLRSCYSTKGRLVPGGPIVDIDWWFCDEGAPIAPRSTCGSQIWQAPYNGTSEIGEVAGYPRVWRDGSRPPDACGGLPPQLNCYPVRLPMTMYCHWALGTRTFEISLQQIPAGNFYGSVPTGIPTYPTAEAFIECESVGAPAHPVVLLTTALVRDDNVQIPDAGSFDALSPPSPRFPQSIPTPEAADALGLPLGAPQLATFDEAAPL